MSADTSLALPVTAHAARTTRFDLLAERIAERTNPVLVKEVRQSLRSTFFRVVFLIALTLTTCVAVGMLAFANGISERAGAHVLGASFFGATLAATALGAVGLVPFAAFASMNAESDQNALELLQLSNLLPFSIVMGKLLSAAIVAVLVVAVDVPFAFLAWTLGGIDPSQILVSIVSLLALSVCLSALAIAVSSLTRVRWARVLLMVLFGFFLFTMVQYGAGLLFLGIVASGVVAAPVSFAAIGACILAVLLDLCATAVAFACDRLAHREESHSTPLRYVATVSAVAGGLIAAAWKIVRPIDSEALGVLGNALWLTGLPLFMCCTEEERLPLGPRARPPRRGPLSLLRALLVAGSGRGAALASLLFVFMAVCFALGCVVRSSIAPEDFWQGLVMCVYAWIYLLLPSGALSFLARYKGGRLAVRTLVLLFPLGAFLGVTLIVFLASGMRGNAAEHIANPFYVLSTISRGTESALPSILGLSFVALLTASINAPRVYRGWRDIWRAQDERDRRVAAALAATTVTS